MYAYEDFIEGKPIHPPPGSTPLNMPYGYVPPQRVGFCAVSGIDFAHFCLESVPDPVLEVRGSPVIQTLR